MEMEMTGVVLSTAVTVSEKGEINMLKKCQYKGFLMGVEGVRSTKKQDPHELL